MNYIEFEEPNFENPAAYSRYLTFSGMRRDDYGNTFSAGIAIRQLTKVIRQMNEGDFKDIIDPNKEYTPMAITRLQDVLIEKLERMELTWLKEAQNINVKTGRREAVQYIYRLKKSKLKKD